MPSVSESHETDLAPPQASARIAIERHRRGNRWMHWLNFPLLTVMIWSGLRIYWADLRDPFVFGIFGWEIFEFFPDWINEPLRLNRKLAWGMAFHFTFAWLFVINSAAFALYLAKTGGWRNFVPTRDDLRTIPSVLLHEAGIRKQAPPQGKYNGVQQLSYGAVLFMGVLAIISGFAIYKPTQLSLLTTMLGGYSSARFIHFAVTIGFMAFFVIHLVQVGRAGMSAAFSMVTGYELLPSDTEERESTAERRVSARVRDSITVVLLPTAVVLFWAAVDTGENANWFTAIALSSIALGFLWDVGWTVLRGATPGKVVNGLQVVQLGSTNTKPNVLQSVLRSLKWLPLLLLFVGSSVLSIVVIVGAVAISVASLAMLMAAPGRRTVMDLLSGTEVVAVAAVVGASEPVMSSDHHPATKGAVQ